MIEKEIKSDGEEKTEALEKPGNETPANMFSISGGFRQRLERLNISIAFSSYQSGVVYGVGRNPKGSINVHQAALRKPMGLGCNAQGGLVVACAASVMRFENVLKDGERANDIFDACYMPRTIHFTGRLDAHDVGLDADDRPIFVNTRYNCLARVSDRHSFEEIWRPPFISALVDEDRCHFNGVAFEDGRPRFATAVSRSDTIDGWRDRRMSGGIVIDIDTGQVLCEGLSMPHSPRLHNGELWVLNSGTGDLGVVPLSGPKKGVFEPRVFCPGFPRGLAIMDGFAFVGLSKPRYKRFEGLPLDTKLSDADSEPWCGIQVIELSSGHCVDWLRIDGPVCEIYDLELLPGVACPMIVSPGTPEAAGLITHTSSVPDAHAPSEALADAPATEGSSESAQHALLAI